MAEVSRRALLTGAAAATLGLTGCSAPWLDTAAPPRVRTSTPSPAPPVVPALPTATGPVHRLIGDGSTADTGPQPHQPVPDRLLAGRRPPQFIVFSWDGAANLSTGLFPRFRSLARELGASMTFFLSGIYALPAAQRMRYAPPRHPVGSSAIGFLSTRAVLDTMREVGHAWLDGHEVGTHFNGHFCGPGGVRDWTPADWASEIAQATRFVQTWKTSTGAHDAEPLPFDYATELTGGRTPCLEGREGLLPTARALGWTYDASSPGGSQVWPEKRLGMWDFPLPAIPFPAARPGQSDHTLAMDYNFLYRHTGGALQGDPARYPAWRAQARDAYLAGFERAYTTNRAPLFSGNHFEQWNGGIYMAAVEDVMREIAGKPEVRLVSFRQMVAWLEAQDPAVLSRLRALPVGGVPPGGWPSFLV